MARSEAAKEKERTKETRTRRGMCCRLILRRHAAKCILAAPRLATINAARGPPAGQERDPMRPGRNIAIKVPVCRWEETVAFYRDRIGLPVHRKMKAGIGFAWGEMTLRIDRFETQSHVDVWLELFAEEPDEALSRLGSPGRVGLEQLDGVTGHWTSDPAGTILLVRRE
jgi:catechol 2,3-dioxygenase-like lactoylglutathione lyase family enzyme